jgi:ubiquinone/menaquinone biosynthesis C-methylase UbiE
MREYTSSSAIANHYDKCFADSELFRFDSQFLAKHIKSGEKVLDLGCGTGRHICLLSSKNCNITGVDMSSDMLRIAKQKIIEKNLQCNLIQADIRNLPFSDHCKFDCVLLMFSTLGLIPGNSARLSIIKNIKPLLKEHGRIYLHLHNFKYHKHKMMHLSRGILNRLKGMSKSGFEPGDHIVKNYRGILDLRIHSFTIDEIKSIADSAGYKLEFLEGLNDNRNGFCNSANINTAANGFFAIFKK